MALKYPKKKTIGCTAAPYPFFSTSTSPLLSFLSTLFSKKEQVGFMPTQGTKPVIQPQLEIISTTEPIDCHHHYTESDTSSSLSSSSESSESLSFEDNTFTLSDILCDHYIQSKAEPNNPLADVPLETFRIFEAPSVEHDHWIWQQEKEWTLVEQSEKYANVKQELKEEQENEADHHCFTRDMRTNSDYFRIIVAEVNMMRANKIVGPLRPRRILAKRSDLFMPRSSCLKYQINL
ncbi:unnamed protein product [Rhizopus stolonifer]